MVMVVKLSKIITMLCHHIAMYTTTVITISNTLCPDIAMMKLVFIFIPDERIRESRGYSVFECNKIDFSQIYIQ